jgi:small-conductance mechanosensitive channel
MSEPWFEPSGILRYRPRNRHGWFVLIITWLVAIGLGLRGFFYTEDESAAWWITGAIAFGAFMVGHAIILWKMDWRYRRR